MMSLDPMLNSRSVAVVGASDRPGSVGDQTIRQLISGGFIGEVFPVNPRYETIHGLTAWPSLAALDRPVDLVVLAVANEHLEGARGAAAADIATIARLIARFSERHCTEPA